MDRVDEYRDLIIRRADQFTVRLVLAAFIGGAAAVLKPGLVPMFWFLAVLFSQTFEHILLDRPVVKGRGVLSDPLIYFMVGLSGLNTLIYISIVFYFRTCGEDGRIFANMLLCGALLHVCLHLYRVRAVQIAGALPPGVLLFVLPLADAAGPRPGAVAGAGVLVLGAALYTAHLVAGVSQNRKFNERLRSAQLEAVRLQKIAQQESEAKSEFVSMISHEIRTPLNAVTTAANLLSRTALRPVQTEYVSILLNGSEVLLGLVNQVLDLSKIEAGKMPLSESAVSVQQIVEKIVGLWRPTAQEKGLNLAISVDENLPSYIEADELRLSQVLVNVLSNAIKFTRSGEVVINVRAARADDGDKIVFEIVDTGPGIPADALNRLFGRFEQGEAGATRRYGGTGLGLAICRNLAELMGGAVTCSSQVGTGSTFRVELPLKGCAPPAASNQPTARSGAAGGFKTVLVADDHDVNRRVLQLLLEPFGWSLVLTCDGEEALVAANMQPFDVILLDHQMPVMSGLDTARRIRSGTGPNAATPIIALTAAAIDESRQAWMAAGAEAFLTKPLDPKALFDALAQLSVTGPRARAAAG